MNGETAMGRSSLAPTIFVVILNWNGRDDTLACLASVMQITYSAFRVLVVDNGSSDDSVSAIRSRFLNVEVIETGSNLGFAGGNNVGIQRALDLGADYVLLLNNDTEVASDLLEALLAAAQRFPQAGAFSAKIYFHAEPDRLWYAGASWNEAAARFEQVGEGVRDDGRQAFGIAAETEYACGCAFFVSAARLREIGLLDADYFLYFEETDWCFRARASGHPSIFVPDAKFWHKVSVSLGGEGSPLQMYFVTRNRLRWARRHGTKAQRHAIWRATWLGLRHRLRPTSAGSGVKAWWWAIREGFADPHSRAMLLGARDYLLGRFGDCPPIVRELAQRSRAKSLASRQTTPAPAAGGAKQP